MTYLHIYLLLGCLFARYTEYCLDQVCFDWGSKTRSTVIFGYLFIFSLWPMWVFFAFVNYLGARR